MVSDKYPGSTRIDIGANVGDSWALMNKHTIADTLLVEGDPAYTELLEFNVGRLGHPNQLCKVFCGVNAGNIRESSLVRAVGTSSIRNAADRKVVGTGLSGGASTEIPMLTLKQILASNPGFKESKLLKLDTDGYDFPLLKENAPFLSRMQATLFYECAPYIVENGLEAGIKDSIESFSEVSKVYKFFIIYDNFGHFMGSIEGDGSIDKYVELMAFNVSCFVDSNRPPIVYFDIAAFTPENSDLYRRLKNSEISRFFRKA
jgi:FkbM family methyltransferase